MALTSALLVDLGIKGSQLTTPDTLPAKYSNKQTNPVNLNSWQVMQLLRGYEKT